MTNACRIALAAQLALLFTRPFTGAESHSDPAMEPPRIVTSPGAEYAEANRKFQGIPGIERAFNGRLWVLWYGGDTREGPQNYVVLVTSGDDGKTWSRPKLVIDPPGFVRAFDACLWHDPQGRMWLFWTQAAGHWDGRGGVWAIVTNDSASDRPRWSKPRRIADGVLMNKPIVLRSGEWLLPITVGLRAANLAFINKRDHLGLTDERVSALSHDLGTAKGVNVFSSTDRGKSFTMAGQAHFPAEQSPCEHMLIERNDGSIWMLVRTRQGIGSAESIDCGRKWSAPQLSGISHPSTRFFIRRLRSGRLLLVKNNPPDGKNRSHLTAFLGDDDGHNWIGGLLLDDRMNVSYPDGVQAPDGRIYIVYDRERFTAREILMAVFTEDDVRGAMNHSAHMRVVVNRAGTQ
jgi:predicted neuraminidase